MKRVLWLLVGIPLLLLLLVLEFAAQMLADVIAIIGLDDEATTALEAMHKGLS